MTFSLPDVKRSEVAAKSYSFVGFGFGRHPLKSNRLMQISFYFSRMSVPPECVICLSETHIPSIDFIEEKKGCLGQFVFGSGIAPFAQRILSGIDLDLNLVRKVAEESFGDVEFFWANEESA